MGPPEATAAATARASPSATNPASPPRCDAASGVTRNLRPKPSFHALAHLHRTLGDHHFHCAILRRNGVYACEFVHGSNSNNADGNPLIYLAGRILISATSREPNCVRTCQ